MTQYFITPNLFNLCDLGQQHNNRSYDKGISGGLNRISKQFLKIHHDGSYHSFISRQMAIALKRYINTKFSKSTPEFVTEIHKKLLCLHEYNLEVAKVKSKYPRSRQLDDLLIRYIELECECLYNGRNRIDEKQENNVQKRVLKLLHVILFEIYKNNENSIKETRDLCLKTIIKFFVTVRAESCNDNNIINNVITNLIDKLGLLEEINKFKGKCIPFYLDTCLQDPEVLKVRQTLTTSDYESNSSDSDDDFEFSDPPFTCPTTENFSTVSLSDMNAIDLSDDEDSFNHIKFKHKPKTIEATSQVKAEIEQFNPIMNNISTDPISILSDDDDNNTDNEARNNLIMNQENLSNGAGNKLTEIKANNKCDNNNDDNNNSNSSYQNMVNTSNHNSQTQLNGNFDNLQQTRTNPTFADSFQRFLTNEQSHTNLSNRESDIFTIILDDDFDIHKLNTQLTSNEKHYMPAPILDCDQIKTEVNDEDRSPNLSVINGQVNSNIVQQTTTLERVNTNTEDMERLQSNTANQPLELEANAEHVTNKEIHEKTVEITEAVNSDDSENVIISQKNVEDTVETTKTVNSDYANCKNVTISQENVEGTIETTETKNNDDSNRENVVISEKNVEDAIETTKTVNNDDSNSENVTLQKNVEDIIETTKPVSNDDSNSKNVVISQKNVEDIVETIKTINDDNSNHENVVVSQRNIEDTIGTTKTVDNDNFNTENVIISQKNVETTKTVKNDDSSHENIVISQKNVENTIGTTKTVDNDDFNCENVAILQKNVEDTVETTKAVKNDDSDHENVISQKNIEDTTETTKTVNITDSNCEHLVISQKNVENTVEITKTVNNDNFNFENVVISQNLEQTEEIVATAAIVTTKNVDGGVATIENVEEMTENPETREHISSDTLPKNFVSLIESVEIAENVEEVDDVKNCENNEDINKLIKNVDTQAEIIENVGKIIEDTDKVVQEKKNVEEGTENIDNMLENDKNGKKVVDVETVEKVDVDFENSEENSAVDEFIDRITEIIDNMSENGETVDKVVESCETETLTNTEEITDGINNTEIKVTEQEVENTENVNSIEIETIECVEKIIQHVEHAVTTLQCTNNGNDLHENLEETMENTANNETININSEEEMIEVFEKPTDIGNDLHENVEETMENAANNETIDINSGEEMIEAVEKSIDIEVTSNNITETLVQEHESIEKLPENCMLTDNSTLEEHFTDIQVSGREEIIDVTIKETEIYPEIPSSEITGDTVIAHEICIESEIIDENSQNSQSTSNETVEDNSEEKILTETSEDVENINEKLSENSNISTETITESQSTDESTVNDQNNHKIAENITEVHENHKLEDCEHLKEVCKQQQIETSDNLVEICENEKLENIEKSNNFTQDNQVEVFENLTKIDQNSILEDTKELDDVDQKSQSEITANSTQVPQNKYLENVKESLQIGQENQTETIENSIGALQNNQIENGENLIEISSSTPIDVADKDQLENTPNINQEDQTKSNDDSTEILQCQQSENMEQPVEILNENEKIIIEEKSTVVNQFNQPEIINDLVTSEQNLEIVEDSNKEVSKNQVEINGKVADNTIIESSACEEISVAETFDKTLVQPEIINEVHHIESIHHEKPRNNRTFTYESTQSSTLNEVEYIDPTHNLGVLATTAVAIADSSTTVTSLSQKSSIINESVNTSTSKRRRSKVRLRRQKVDIPNENKRITRNSVNKNNNNTKNNQFEVINSSKSKRHSTDIPITTTTTTKCLAHDFISTENSSIPPQINHVYAQKRLVEANTTSEDSNDSSESTLFIDESNEWKNDKVNERNSNSVYEDETEDDCLKFIDTELNDDDNDDNNKSGRKVTQAEKRCDEIVENKNNSSICISIPENNDSNQFADNGVLKQMEDFVETQIEIVENTEQVEDNRDQEISFDRNEIVHKKFDHEKFIKEKTAQQVDDKLRDNNNKTPTDHSIKHILNNVNEQNIKESTVDNNKEETSSKLKENDENSITNPAIIILEDRIIKTKGALKAFDQEKENTATLIENCFESGKDGHRKIIRSRSKSCNQIINDNVKDKINFNDDLSITKNSKLVTDLTTLKNSKIQIKENIILNVETEQINEEVLHADSNKNESDGLLDLSIGDGNKTSDGAQEKIEAPISTTMLKDQIEIVEKIQNSSNKTPKDNLTDIGEQDEIVLTNNSKIHEEKLETKVAEVRNLENDTTINNVSLKLQHKKSPTRNKGKSLENTIKKMKERAIKEKNSSEHPQLLDEISKFEEESSSPNLNSSFIETKTEKSLSKKQGKTSNIDDKSQSPKTDRKSSDRYQRSTRSSKSKISNSKQRESDKKDDSCRSRSSSKSIEIMTERSRSRSRSSSKSKTSNNKQKESDKKDDSRRSRSSSKSIEIMTERSRSRSKSKSKSNNNNNNNEKEQKRSSRSKSKERNNKKAHSTEKERSKTPSKRSRIIDKDKVNNNLDNREERSHSKSKDTKSHKDIDKKKVDVKERGKDDKSRSKSPRNSPADTNNDDKTDIDLNKLRDDLKKSLSKSHGQVNKQKNDTTSHSKEKRAIDSDKGKKEKVHKSHKNGDKIKHNLDDNKKNEEKSEKFDQKTKHKMDHHIKKNGDKGSEQLDQKTKQTVVEEDGKKDKYEKVDAKTKNRLNENNKKTEIKDIGSINDAINENMKKNEEKNEKSNEESKQKIDENKPNSEGVEIKKSDKPKEKNKVKETSNDERTTKHQAKDNGETNQKKKTSIDQIFEEAFKRAELERKSKQQQQIVDNKQNKDETNKEIQKEPETIKITEDQKMRKRQSTDSIELETEEYKRQKLIDNSKESQNNIQEDMQIEKLDHGKIIVNIQPPLPPPLPLSTPPLPPPPPSSPPPLPPPPPPLPTSPPPPPPPLPPDIADETKTPNETQVIKNNLQVLPTTSKTIPKTTNNDNFEQIDGIVTPGAMELESPTKILLTNDIQTTDTFFVNNTFSTSCNLNMQVLSSTVDTTVKDFPTTETVTSTNLQTSVSIHCGVIAQSVNIVNTTQDPTNIPNDKNCLFTFSNDTTTPTSTVTNSSNLTTLNDLEQMELIAAPHHTHSHHHPHHHHHRTTHVMVSLSDSIDVVQNNPPVVETEVEIQSIQDYDGSFNLGGPMVSGRREEKTITTPTDLTLNDSSPDEFPLTSEELELSFNDNNLIDDYFNPCKTEKPDFDNTIIIDTNDTMTTKTDEIQNSIKDLNYLIGITQSDEQIKNDDDDDNDNNNNNDNDVEDVDDVSSNSNSNDTDDQTINSRPPTDSINDATLYAVNNLISLGSGESSSETHTFTSISDIDIMESSKESLNSLNTAIPSTSTTPDIVTKPTYSSDCLSNQSNENHSTITTITPNNNDDTNNSNKNNDTDNNCVDNDDGVKQKVIVQKIEQAPMSIDILEKAYINNCKPTPSSSCSSSSSSSSTSTKNNVSKFIQSVKRNETTKKNESNVNDVMEKFTGRKHNRTPVSAPRRNQQKPVSSSKTSPQNDLSNDNSNNKEASNVPELRIRVKKDLGATLFDTDLLQQEQQQQKSEIPSQRHSYAVENLLNLRTNDTESQQSTSDSETSRKRKHLYDDFNSDGEKRRRKSDDSIDDREKRNNEIFDKLLKQGPINKCMLTQNYETKPIALSSSASTSSSASSSSAIIMNTRTQEMLARSRVDNERQVQRQYYPPPTTTVITTVPPIITTLPPPSLLLPPPPLAASSSSSSVTSASHSQTLQHYPGGSSSSSNGSTSSNHNRREGARHRHEGTRQRITSYPRNLDRRSSTEPVSKTSKWYVKPLLMHSVTRNDRSHSHIRPDDRRLSAAEANSKRQTYGETVRNPRLQKDEDKFLWLQKCSGIFDSPPLFEVPENN